MRFCKKNFFIKFKNKNKLKLLIQATKCIDTKITLLQKQFLKHITNNYVKYVKLFLC